MRPSVDQLQEHLKSIEPARLRLHLTRLSIVRNQLLNPRAIGRVKRYVEETFDRAGLAVRTEPFWWWGSGWRRHHNLIATIPAGGLDDERIIIGAHYDSVPFSPGADDNASGVAVLLETARVCAALARWPRRRIDFIAFGMEEEGCVGSRRHADRLARLGAPVTAMVSLECVGYTDQRPRSQRIPPGVPVHVPDRGTFLGVIGNGPARPVTALLARAIQLASPQLETVTLVVDDGGLSLPATRLSDHAPFWDRGYPALMLTDTAFLRNPHYHQSHDLPDTLDLEFMARVARSVAALTLMLADGDELADSDGSHRG
ncbi:MAG TPA: M20/M25/M40 family metallo-hydrolase [Nitrospiria bacterium]|nr:M20/M25/M40 family metallo-hydrolase [Nitrospiria bacterium]